MICDPRQSASATSSKKSVRCQSADPRITADLRPHISGTAVNTVVPKFNVISIANIAKIV